MQAGFDELAFSERCDAFDLDKRVLSNETADYHSGRRRPGRSLEQVATELGCLLVVVEREHVVGGFDDIGEASAHTFQERICERSGASGRQYRPPQRCYL